MYNHNENEILDENLKLGWGGSETNSLQAAF